MCDTFVILPDATRDGSLIFGKNSDREPNEAEEVVFIPAADHAPGTMLRCTYLDIPQVEHTHAVLLLKPFWMWGAEMGANEHGVVIGNEAVFTKLPVAREQALTGMDLIRLGLERACSAEQALETIIELLERFGQGGNGGFTHPLYYHNSFIIADARSAWVLETAGKEWAAEQATGVRSISNAITIGSRWDRASQGLAATAVSRGWVKRIEDFDFGRDYSDTIYTTFSAARSRQACTTHLLAARKGQLGVEDAFRILRAHGIEPDGRWRPDVDLTGASVCAHVGFGPVRVSQSVGSLVAHLTPERKTYWVTGTSAPCTSVFKPVWFESGIPWRDEPAPGGTFNPACLWWRHEQLHRRLVHGSPAEFARLDEARRSLESEFIQAAGEGGDVGDVASSCYRKAEEFEREWLERALHARGGQSRFYYRLAWNQFNREAKMDLRTP